MLEWRRVKRALDVAIAGAGLVMTAPVLAAAAVAIKLESPGPVLFKQRRTGRGRQPIQTLKLRTMVVDAERSGPQVTAGGDPRITRVGRWLRRTKLDELPQLWNVVRGDMSLVGPRPEVARYTDLYPPEWEPVFSVRPGLTDLASLTFRDEESLLATADDRERAYTEVIMPMKLELALDSVARSSPAHDLGLIGRTILALVDRTAREGDRLLDEARRRIADLNASPGDS
jgi:lipopolysaccharide/colanic/teichoic acid biosynthesis glycosyltransferase